jgi:hypothetical protein
LCQLLFLAFQFENSLCRCRKLFARFHNLKGVYNYVQP